MTADTKTRYEPTPFLAHHGYTAEVIEYIVGPDAPRDWLYLLELSVSVRLLEDAGYKCRLRVSGREP
jgi:hypothetical protein